MASKRVCILNENLRKKYPYLEETKVEGIVLCKKCDGKFSIASGGNADIVRHIGTNKHKNAVAASASSQPISSFFSTNLDTQSAAMEGVWVYHTISSNHSFRSTDCETKVFKSCFKLSRFSCSHTKCHAITSIFGRHVQEILLNDLADCNYVSIYTDASNVGNIKLFPVLVRYFHPLTGAHVKVLDITSQSGETSTIIADLILAAAEKFGLKNKIVCFCADNAKVNFGGETRGGQNNVYYRLKTKFPYLIGIGCVAHIEHNAMKFACDVLPFDVECIVVKIYSHFYRNTVRVATLKSFCDEADEEYVKLLGYVKTRFLALKPAAKRILQMFAPLKTYFTSLPKGEKMLKDFFNEKSSYFWMLFILEQVKIKWYTLIQLIEIQSYYFCL